MMQKIYFISGLGANEQVFSKLKLQNIKPVYLKWLTPETEEPLAHYAKRMFQQIDEINPVLAGLSFGGIVAVEIAKQFPIEKLILISTAKTRKELPWWMKTSAKLRLHEIIHPKPHPLIYPIENFFLGVTSSDERNMANSFRRSVNDYYLQWAIHAIVNWNNVTIPENLTHIHGTNDKIFPIRNIKADFVIPGGGHFMVYNRADEISKIITKLVQHSLVVK